LPGRRRKSLRHAVGAIGIFSVACLEGHAHARRIVSERVERHARGAELVAVSGLDVAVPEVGAEPDTAGATENDLPLPARLAPRRGVPPPDAGVARATAPTGSPRSRSSELRARTASPPAARRRPARRSAS